MMLLKQSAAIDVIVGPFLDETDGKTPETGLTISQADVRLFKNGGVDNQKNDASAATHYNNGYYKIDLDATDTGTLGRLLITISEGGALPVWREFVVVPANVYDSLVGGSDALEVDATLIEGVDATDQINAECDTALADYDGPTQAEMDTALTEIKGAGWYAGSDTLEKIREAVANVPAQRQTQEI